MSVTCFRYQNGGLRLRLQSAIRAERTCSSALFWLCKVLPRLVFVLLLFFLQITSAVADDGPMIPRCLHLADYHHFDSIARDDFTQDLEPSGRRNAKYFFDKLSFAGNGPKPLQAFVLNYGPVSVFFPARECPEGCIAFLVRANERENLVKRIFFVSHIANTVYPILSSLFLAADGERFIEIRTVISKAGNSTVEVRELRSPPPLFFLRGHQR